MGIALRNHTQYLLVPMGALLFWFGFKMTKAKEDKEIKRKAAEAAEKSSSQQGAAAPENDAVAPLDPLQLQLGFALIPLVDKEKGAELLERITRIRRECALDIGLPVPKIRIIDNMSLEPNEYVFQIRGIKAGGSKLRLGYYMCMNTGLVTEEIPGEVTKDPAFGMPAIWVPEERRAEAEQAGYAVIDPPTVIATHITEFIKISTSCLPKILAALPLIISVI